MKVNYSVRSSYSSVFSTSYVVLKTVPEVISFPMRIMVVFGGSTSIGPVTWLRAKSVDAAARRAKPSSAGGNSSSTMSNGSWAAIGRTVDNGGVSNVAHPEGGLCGLRGAADDRVVKGRTAADMLSGSGLVMSESGTCLVLESTSSGSWAAGKVAEVVAAHVARGDEVLCLVRLPPQAQ